ncbi:MAG: hypothetical protein JRN45_00645 [Nitrososphaerota archaeon]|nr:hypothetical protein [Nitrososphaerota archaeon]
MDAADPQDVEDATTLVSSVWRGMDWNKWRRNRMTIYNIFTNNIKAAAHTVSLGEFYDKLMQRMCSSHFRDEDANAILQSGRDEKILTALREQTALVILKMRVERQPRWQAARKEKLAREEETEVR